MCIRDRSYYKDYILDFVWTVSRDHQTRQSRGRISCGRVRIDDSSWGSGFTRFKHRYQAEIDGCVNSLRAALEACPEGLWQAPWPAIAPETQFLVSRPEFLEKVVSWPPEKGIAGIEYRDFNRITQLVRGLENRLFHPDVIEVPRVWVAAHHMTRTEATKAIKLKATEAQLSVLRACASRVGPVPPLDVDMACGQPGDWNFQQPEEQKKANRKNQRYHPPCPDGEFTLDRFLEFLRLRTMPEGSDYRNLGQLFKAPVPMEQNWFSMEFVNWDSEKLPAYSEGPHADMSRRPSWVDYYHGIKVAALAAILSTIENKDGGLKESGDKSEEGHRYNQYKGRDIMGVYFHPAVFRQSCYGYARFCPCMGDAGFVRVIFEVVADSSYRVAYKHETQRVQMGNGRSEVKRPNTSVDLFGGPSFYYKSMQVQVCNYRQMPQDSMFELVWNSALEARPPHITEEHGEARRDMVTIVATPPGYKPGDIVHRSRYAHSELGALGTEERIKSEEPTDDANGVVDVTMSEAARVDLGASTRASLGGPSTLAPQVLAGAASSDWGEWEDVAGPIARQMRLATFGSAEVEEQRKMCQELRLHERVVPGPLERQPVRNASSPWHLVLQDHFKRFHPGIEAHGVLRDLYGLPSLSFLTRTSDGERRYRASQYRGTVLDMENVELNSPYDKSPAYACRRACLLYTSPSPRDRG